MGLIWFDVTHVSFNQYIEKCVLLAFLFGWNKRNDIQPNLNQILAPSTSWWIIIFFLGNYICLLF